MRKIVLSVLVAMFMACPIAMAAETSDADETKNILDEYSQIYGEHIQNGVNSLTGVDINSIAPGFDAQSILNDSVSGRLSLNPVDILKGLGRLIGGEVYACLKIMILILILSILTVLLTNLSGSFSSDGIANIAFFACYTLIVTIACGAFYLATREAQSAVQNMAVFMNTLIPLVITSLIASGAIVSASVFQPTLILIIEVSVSIIKNIFIPLLMLSTVVTIVSNLSSKFSSDKLAQLLNKTVKWGIGVVLTVFVGVVGISGISTAAVDGMSVKVTKFAAGSLVPVVGGILAESVETVMSCSVVMKNAIGIVGTVILVIIAVFPIVKLMAQMIIFRLTAAVMQPIADSRIVECISSLADTLGIMFSIVASVGIMFVIMLTIMINTGSSAVMLGR